MPVGFKNGTDGGVQIAIDAVRAAAHPHSFLGVTEQGLAAIVVHPRQPGLPRDPARRARAARTTTRRASGRRSPPSAPPGLPPRLMIDTSHGNSEKDYRRQPQVAQAIAAQIARGRARHHRRA